MKTLYARFVLFLIRPAIELSFERDCIPLPNLSDTARQAIIKEIRQTIIDEMRPGGLL